MMQNSKGCKELLMQRMFLAIVSSIALKFFFMSCLILITNISTDYSSWFQDTWTAITSFRMWKSFFVLATIIFLQGVICSKSYLNTPPYVGSRFAKICGVFTSHNVLLAALHINIGGLLVWLHLSLKGGKYSSSTENCNQMYGTCLVEEHYFLILSGLWSGLYFFMKTNIFQVKYLKFPIISLPKFFQLKRGIYSMLPSLMVASVWSTFYYLICYYFLGYYCRSTILFLTSTQLETQPLDTISGILNLSLLFHLWMYQLIFILTINSMDLLFQIYLTEWISFEFRKSNVLDNDSGTVTLPEALSMEKIPIMQQLGYLDLVTLAQKDKSRRSILFTLSQPGGHPYNWNCIVEKCIGLIKKFTDDLNTESIKIHEPLSNISNMKTANSATFQKDYVYHMRSLVPEKTLSSNTDQIDKNQVPDTETFIHKFVKAKWQNFLNYLLSKPLVYYFFGELEGGKVCYILFNGQPVIWAADAISSLCVLSLREDSYGIVQKDLPLVINTLLALKQTLDKLQKSNLLTKRQHGDDEYIKQIFVSLRAAVKRSTYRIVTSFEDYIADLALETATVEQLQGFLNYRE